MPASVNQHEIIARIAQRLKRGSEMADKKPLLNVSVADGEYHVVLPVEGGLCALRHGKPWRNLCGDNLVLALANELDDARQKIAKLEQALKEKEWACDLLKDEVEILKSPKDMEYFS